MLARATALLERGRGTAAAELLEPLLQSRSVKRQDEFVIRAALAEANLLQGEPDRAATVLGRPPDQIRDPLPQALLSSLWRLHGRVAYARGEQSRAIALHARALKHAEAAHDSRGIGLAHFELVYCYQKVGDHAIVREHLTEAAAALHAAGDRRHLAQVHSMSGIMSAQQGRYDDATAALRNAERIATALGADDVLAQACVNQAAVAQLRRRYDQAIALAERAVALHETTGQPHQLAGALATLGHINVKLGHLDDADALEYMGLQPNQKMTDIELDVVWIGSCTNGRIEDLRQAAKIVEGKKISSRLAYAHVVPGSGLVKAQAEAEGLDKIFKAAGFEWREPGCSMCLGMNPDQLKPGQRCAATSNRNFEGRQGYKGRTHLVSPAMAAAAAIAGRFVDVRDVG